MRGRSLAVSGVEQSVQAVDERLHDASMMFSETPTVVHRAGRSRYRSDPHHRAGVARLVEDPNAEVSRLMCSSSG